MKEKKHSADWYIAATHYLTAGFVIPFIINFVGAIFLVSFLLTGLKLYLILILLNLLGVWFGVKYSAAYLKKTYIITNKNKIIKLATMYYGVIFGLYITIQVMSQKVTGNDFVFEVIKFIAIAYVLYVASKKYISEDAPVSIE